MASIEDLLDEMEDIMSDARGKAFSNRMTIDVEAMRAVIDDLRDTLPEEIKQAQLLASERREILDRATREADMVISDAKIISRDLIASAEKRAKDMDAQTAHRTEQLIKTAQAKAQETVNAAREEVAKAASQDSIVVEAQAQADRIKADADKYLESAQREARRLVEDAEHKSKEQLAAATEKSRDLKLKASAYVNDIVTDAEYRIGKSYAEIKELQKSMNTASKKSSKPAREIKKKESGFVEPRLIRHPSVIDVPIDDDFGSPYYDDPPLHEKSDYNIQL